MGVHTGNHRRLTRCPVSSFGFGPHYRLPAFWLQAQEDENRMCTEWPRLVLDYWGGKCSEPQSASEHATSTSRQNRVQIQYLNPSRLKTGARASGPAYTAEVDPSQILARTHAPASRRKEKRNWEPNYNWRLLPSGRPTPLLHSPGYTEFVAMMGNP